ncbi:MAG: sigma-70 family RNA polymerase sigma factor, partial [Caldilineaceae bacterium]|nr:sigma-70 family RNA polymerase sigma factor [Caldilineaceae bacterium]
MTKNNHQLLLQCRRGDARAWQQLVHHYGPLVHSIPVRYGLSQAEVDDVGQEVFLALAQGLARIEDLESLPAWLITTARRYSWRALQKRQREQPLTTSDLAEVEFTTGRADARTAQVTHHFGQRVPSVNELLEGWQSQEILAQSLEKLNDRCRVLLTAIF